MTQATTHRCSICSQQIHMQRVITDNGPVEIAVCLRCDRRRCGVLKNGVVENGCGVVDVTGTAKACVCGRALFGNDK